MAAPHKTDTQSSRSAHSSREQTWQDISTSAHDPESFATAWLARQCREIGHGAVRAVVVFGQTAGPFAPVAVWPDKALGSPWLIAGVEKAIANRDTVIERGKKAPSETDTTRKLDVIARPLLVDEQIFGAVAVEIEHESNEKTDTAVEKLAWGMVWLEAFVRRNKYTSADRLVSVLELIATALHHERFQAAATAVATELAGNLQCERVSIAFVHGKHAHVKALSHSASFVRKANVIRAIEAAMDEAIDQQTTVRYPGDDDARLQVTRAHEALSGEFGPAAICSIPMAESGRILGALTLERPADESFDDRSVQLCEHIAALIGPLLEVKRKDDRLLIRKAGDSMADFFRKLTGPRHALLKVISTGLLMLAIFLTFFDGDFRVTADARLEGAVQRAVAAPMAGYVVDANVQAGDVIAAGDVMFTLDDRELTLERLKWLSQKAQYSREYNQAMATRNRSTANVSAAQIEQAEAQIALIEEQLARVRVIAPFDGFVVSGDLSQSLGVPVERGDVLFELAPLHDYRVILNVDERDISQLAVGQSGILALTGLPGETPAIIIEKITPVATAEDGRNFFRVEARLADGGSPLLRPGMEGIGKVSIEQRRLIWIWTYKIIYWLRMFIWSWWP